MKLLILKQLMKSMTMKIIRCMAYCLRIFPVNNNRILFYGSTFEAYTCNPKYLYEYLKGHYGQGFEYIWEFKHPENYNLADEAKLVKHNTFKWLYMMATSKVIVVNNGMGGLHPKRKNQLVIETWHAGGAYKIAGITCRDVDYIFKWRQKKMKDDVSVRLSSSQIFTKYNILKGNPFNGEIWDTGMPRNDIFFSQERVLEARSKVRKRFGITGRLILYAPTFRGNVAKMRASENIIDLERTSVSYQVRCRENVSVFVRAHFGTEFKNTLGDGIMDVSTYSDMQELLCAADILITDYSSSIWDYALLGRPCFLYVPDLEEYERKDRGFFTPIETWPGIICHDMDELCYEIEHLDEDRCREIARKHLEYAGSYEQGTACETVCRKIVDFCRGGRS